MASEPEEAHGPLAADRTNVDNRIVVKAAGQLDPLHRRPDPLQCEVIETVLGVPDVSDDLRCEHPFEGFGEVGLHRPALWSEPLLLSIGVGELRR